MANTVIHFAHKEHPLSLTNLSSSYTCDGCRSIGSGPRYRCNRCDFDLHEFCAKCPEYISFFGHPHHQLVLVPEEVWKKLPAYNNGAHCDLCFEPAGGMMYRCTICYMDIHLLCSLLPPTVTDAPAHAEHELALVPHLPGVCTVCSGSTKIWHYRCAPCNIDIHPQCVGETQMKSKEQSNGAREEQPVEQQGKQRKRKIAIGVAKSVLKFGVEMAGQTFVVPFLEEALDL